MRLLLDESLLVSVVVLAAHSNEYPALLPLLPNLERALADLKPRVCITVEA